MTDYDDGKWHIWNGGECPVHPKSIVQVQLADETRMDVENEPEENYMFAGGWEWDLNGDASIIAFRVVNPHVQPREWWINDWDKTAWATEEAAHGHNEGFTNLRGAVIHVREVLPE